MGWQLSESISNLCLCLIMGCIGIGTVSTVEVLGLKAHNSLLRFVAVDLRHTSAVVSAEKVNPGQDVSWQDHCRSQRVTQHLNLDLFLFVIC